MIPAYIFIIYCSDTSAGSGRRLYVFFLLQRVEPFKIGEQQHVLEVILITAVFLKKVASIRGVLKVHKLNGLVAF